MLEVFDAARYAQHIAFAYRFVVRRRASDMRLGVMQRRKQYDHERVRCTKGWVPGAEDMDSGSSFF